MYMKTVIYTADILVGYQISDPILSHISLRLQCYGLIPDSCLKSMDVFQYFESQAHAKQQVQITCAAAWLLNRKNIQNHCQSKAIFQYMFDTLNNGPSASNSQHMRKVVKMSDKSNKEKALCSKGQNCAEQASWEQPTQEARERSSLVIREIML